MFVVTDRGDGVEFGERRQRLSRLLGRDAMLVLDLADSEPEDLDQPDNAHQPELDENLNRKPGTTFMSRVQDYSTNSLEFSDAESLVSDSVGRQSDDDGAWNHSRAHQDLEELELDRQPVGFVEFTPANVDDDDDVDKRPRQSRSLVCFNILISSFIFGQSVSHQSISQSTIKAVKECTSARCAQRRQPARNGSVVT